jgi:CDP-diacylglycerol---serine O-phosphatidyltransferase
METPPIINTKIYLLPNLMTAGNLLCGFMALLKIFEGAFLRSNASEVWMESFEASLYFILGAFIFDMLDGRLARLGGRESPFGREFDSLADIVSFGVAPAMLVFLLVLHEFPNRIGWLVAAIYLICGALRLARYNVHATLPQTGPAKEFTGFPIPAAAGLVCSITLLMLHLYETKQALESGWGKYFLVPLLFFLSFMMFSKFKYPSFKALSLRTEHSIPKFLGVLAALTVVILFYQWMLAVVFVGYLFYGFLRPFLSRAMRREIEEDEVEETEPSQEMPK